MPPKKRKFDEAGSSQRSPRKRVNAADSSQQSLDSFLLSGRSAQNKAIVKEERSGAPREIIIIDDNEEEATYSHKGLATENVDIAIDSTITFNRLGSHSHPNSPVHPPFDGFISNTREMSAGSETSSVLHNKGIPIKPETAGKSNDTQVFGDETSLVDEKHVGVTSDGNATMPLHSTSSHSLMSTPIASVSTNPVDPRAQQTIAIQIQIPPLEPFPNLTLNPFLFEIRPRSPEGHGTSACSYWTRGTPAPYSLLVHALVSLAATKSRIAILSILTNLLRILIVYDSESVLPALYLLSNSLGAAWEGIELGVGGSIISKILQTTTSITSTTIRNLYKKYGDPGDVAYYAVVGESSGPRPSVLRPHPPLLIGALYKDLRKIASSRGEKSQKIRRAITERLLLSAVGSSWKSGKPSGQDSIIDLNPHLLGEEARYLVRTLIQNLRVGAVRTTILSALARAIVFTTSQQRRADPTALLRYSILASDCDTVRKVLLQVRKQDETGTSGTSKKSKQISKAAQTPEYLAAQERVQNVLKRAEACLRKTYAQHPRYDDIVPVLLREGIDGIAGENSSVGLSLGVPVMHTLGSPMRSLDDVYERLGPNASWTAEMKYDGQRAQVHAWRKNGQIKVKIFSRHLEDMTDKYPDIVYLISRRFDTDPFLDSFIVDSEAVAVDRFTGELRSFQELAGRARRDVKISEVKVAVCLYLFDMMYLNGTPLIQKPFRERRRLLRTHLPPSEPVVAGHNDAPTSSHILARLDHVESVEADEGREVVEEFWEKAIESKCEGLMIKLLDDTQVTLGDGEEDIEDDEDLETPKRAKKNGSSTRRKALPATYEPDKRTSAWLKLKKDYVEGIGDSLDLVPVGAWHGNGRKAAWWSPILLAVYDPAGDQLVALCKCMSGFTDAFYKELNEKYPEGTETCSKTSLWNVETGGYKPNVYFKPSEVWEIRGADLTISPTSATALGMIPQARDRGLSLRFPRFMRIRLDKKIEMASTPAFVHQLWRNQESKGQALGIGEDELVDVIEEESVEEEYESSSDEHK